MPSEVSRLVRGERSRHHFVSQLDSPRSDYTAVQSFRYDQPTIVQEGDESAIEQMINVRRQQEPIGSVQLLFIIALAPRLDVTRPEVLEL